MTITEKKPLLIQIPGERNPNELPMTASAVGYDFVQGNYITYATGSDSWETAPEMKPIYWQSDSSGHIYTTGSIFVYETISTTNLAVSNIATVSGSVILGDAAADVVYISGSVTASNGLLVNGNLNVSGGIVTYGGTTVDGGTIVGQQFEDTDTSGNSYGLVIKNSGTGNGVPFLSFVQGATVAAGFAGGIGGWTKTAANGYIPGLNLSFYSSYPRIGIRNASAGLNIATFDANGLQVTGSVNVSNGVKVAAGGLQVAGIVPGISAPYNNTPVIIDLANGQTYGPVIRSMAGQYNFAALSFDQNGTYLGGIYGLANDPSISGYLDGLNFATTNSRNLVFNVNNIIIGKFSTSGLQVTGSINGSSTITAATGFSGSLTTLTNGTSYIIAGNGISVSSASNGAITISSSVSGGTPGGTNTQIQYNNSGSFGGVTNLTWDGATLNATGSFKGNLDGTASYATNAATASYVLNAVTASYATVAVSLTTNVFNVALNGTALGVSTNIGGIYIPATTTVTTKSLAYIGGSTGSEVAVLKLVPINSVTVSASWVITGTLSSVSLSNPATLGPGWYDLTLETGTVSQTAFGRGLYLTSGDI